MTTNRYIILLISIFAYLFIPFFILAMLIFGLGFDINPKPYAPSILLVLTTYPIMIISVTSYLLGRAIFVPKKSTVNKALLVIILLITYLISASVLYEKFVNNGDLTVWQYSIHSIITITMFVVLPIFLARPNKFLLKLTAKFHKGF
jgi:hypothetical protein